MGKSLVIGITGPLGAGKTTAASYFPKQWKKLDVDALGHQLLEKTKIKKKLCAVFGKQILEKNSKDAISREKLRQLLSENPRKIMQINKIIHPELQKQIKKILKKAKKRKQNIVVDCALVEQLRLAPSFDILILIIAPKKILTKRRKKSWTKKQQVLFRKQQKMPKAPDYIINNVGTKQELRKNIQKIVQLLKKHKK